MLPNLLIIGAAKCGTTSLHSYLGLHPEIFMSRPKELMFWSRADCLDRLSEYESRFPVDRAVRGESSGPYSMYPIWSNVPERMHRVIPDAKLIYLVRDPVERTIAHYFEAYAGRVEFRQADDALSDDWEQNRYLAASRYATQVEQYMRFFPRANLLVVDQGDLRQRREETLASIFAFLGVDPSFRSPQFSKVRNKSEGKRRVSPLRVRVRSSAPANLLRRLPEPVQEAAFRPVRRLLSRPLDHPVVSEHLRRRLARDFEQEIERLSAVTGRSYRHWPFYRLLGLPD